MADTVNALVEKDGPFNVVGLQAVEFLDGKLFDLFPDPPFDKPVISKVAQSNSCGTKRALTPIVSQGLLRLVSSDPTKTRTTDVRTLIKRAQGRATKTPTPGNPDGSSRGHCLFILVSDSMSSRPTVVDNH